MLGSGVKTQAQLADILGISQAAVTQALSKGKIPDVWLYKVAYQTGRRVEWLRTGEGPEFLNEVVAETEHRYGIEDEAVRLYLTRRLSLDDDRRETIDHLMDLLLRADDTTREALLLLLSEKRESSRQQRRSASSKKASGSA